MSPLFFSHTSRSPFAKALMSGAAVALLTTAGCASVGAPPASRTLGSFEQLTVQQDGTRAWRNAALGRYTAVRIDPAAVAFAADVKLDDEQRAAIRDALVSALSERLAAAGLQVIADAGGRASVATVRATITEVELAIPAVNVITTLLVLAPLSHGGMTVEIEALDARSGERAAALAFAGQAGVQNVFSAFSGIGHAKVQAGIVAQKFSDLLVGPSKSNG